MATIAVNTQPDNRAPLIFQLNTIERPSVIHFAHLVLIFEWSANEQLVTAKVLKAVKALGQREPSPLGVHANILNQWKRNASLWHVVTCRTASAINVQRSAKTQANLMRLPGAGLESKQERTGIAGLTEVRPVAKERRRHEYVDARTSL